MNLVIGKVRKTEPGKQPNQNVWTSVLDKFMRMFGDRPENSVDYEQRRTQEELGEEGTGDIQPATTSSAKVSDPRLREIMRKLGLDEGDVPSEEMKP